MSSRSIRRPTAPRPSPTRSPSSTSRTARRPRARSSAASTCPMSATSCTTSAGTRARARSARGRRIRTSSVAYLLIPGLRSRPHPRGRRRQGRPGEPEAREGRRGRGVRPAHRLQPPAHGPLRPRRALHVRARQPRRRRPGRRPPPRPRRLLAARAVEVRPRPPEPRLRRLVEHRLRHAPHRASGARRTWSRTASTPSSWPVRPPPPHLGPQEAPPQAGGENRPRRRAADGARAAPGTRPDQAVRVRRRRRLDRRPQRLGVAVGAPGGRVGRHQEGHHDSPRARPRPSSCRPRCSRSARCRRSSPTSP